MTSTPSVQITGASTGIVTVSRRSKPGGIDRNYVRALDGHNTHKIQKEKHHEGSRTNEDFTSSSFAMVGLWPGATLLDRVRTTLMRHAFIGPIGAAVALYAFTAIGQTARDIRGPAAVVPLASESAPRIVIDPPLADPLAHGRVVIQYRAENLRIVPVFSPAALAVSPRIGHIHVTVDDALWHWADASGEPLIMNGFPAGPHKVLIELVNPNHQTVDKGVITFVIPKGTEPDRHN